MIKKLLLILACCGLFTSLASAHGNKVAGPNGGRILTSVTPHVEFFVTSDRKIQFTFLDDNNKPIAPTAQSITVTTGSRSQPATLSFKRNGNVLLSETSIPEGNRMPAVIQLTPAPGATAVTEKFNINLATCSECKNAEYACICDH